MLKLYIIYIQKVGNEYIHKEYIYQSHCASIFLSSLVYSY